MTSQTAKILNAFARGIAPPQRLPLKEWAARNVKLSRSSRSTHADLSLTPWLVEPLEAFFNNSNSEVVLCFPPGAGKSTLFEIAAAYIVAERPGPALFTVLSDTDAKEWADVGLRPVLENCEAIKPLWPKDRHKNTKGLISFPHMPLWVSGANVAAFQGKSCDYVFCDEGWQIKKSLLKEARARTHDRLFSKFILASQAGLEGDEFTGAFNASRTHEFCFLCPSCSTRQPWQWDRLSWGEDLKPVYSCVCGYEWQDTPQERRAMSESGEYVAQSEGRDGLIAYTFNALAVWWIPWAKLVHEFLFANEAKKKGDIAPLRQFTQKRLSKFWSEEAFTDPVTLNTYEYKLGAAAAWKPILTVDVQKSHFFFVVRDWSAAGESRLLDYGRLNSFAEIDQKAKQWGTGSKAVFLDSAYRTEEVKTASARYGWIGLNGRADRDFPASDAAGRKFRRIFGMPQYVHLPEGRATNVYFSSNGAKSIVDTLRRGEGAPWQLPSDVPEEYIDALTKSERPKATERGIVFEKLKYNNHAFHCEAMQVIGAMIHKLFVVSLEPAEPEASALTKAA
jgi:phage terminase large subunit GpA-like protein